MRNKNKKIFLFFFIGFLFFVFVLNADSVYADRPLEIRYPSIPGSPAPPETVTAPIPEYVKYIFNFSIWISGIIALVVLVIAGFQYFTSSGNMEKMKDAKDKIGAAFLGLVILFGSYLILININPELVSFEIKRIRPILPALQAGTLLCKEIPRTGSGEDAVMKAWELEMEYKLTTPTIEREKEIKKEMDELLDKISLECYSVLTGQNILPAFDNKVKYAYFIPTIETKETKIQNPTGGFIIQKEITEIIEYGAIIYEEESFTGKTQVLGSNLIDINGTADVYRENILLEASSIKPFALIYLPDQNWQAVLYQEKNQNIGTTGLTPFYVNITTSPECVERRQRGEIPEWWCALNLPWAPKSIKIEGDLLVILCKGNLKIDNCDVFTSNDANLEDNLNIVNWVSCREYQSSVRRGFFVEKCAEPAADYILVISAKLL